ncbi:MAG: hypothetical protein IEMM0008_0222 [bacterium]|nr:MAG: hypothetical protein IEMM0008_0222 [bacterium]
MALFGFSKLLLLLPGKMKIVFLSLFFLGQGALGPVPADMIPKGKEIRQFNRSYFRPELTRGLPKDTYFYGFINRLDVASQNYMTLPLGKKLSQIPLARILDTVMPGEKPLHELQTSLKRHLDLTARDIYALTKAKLEIALTSDDNKISLDNLIIAYYPTIDVESTIKKLITGFKSFYKKEEPKKSSPDPHDKTESRDMIDSRDGWSIPWGYMHTVNIHKMKRHRKKYYIITFSDKAFERYKDRMTSSAKDTLDYRFRKKGMIRKLGKGAYFGLYVSINDLVNKSDWFQRPSRDSDNEVDKFYRFFSIQSFLTGESFEKGLYHEKTELAYDPRYKSVFQKLTPLGLTKRDFRWLPTNTRLVWSLSFKELPNIMNWIGDLVYTLGGKREYRSYKRELKEVKREIGIDLNDLMGVLSGKVMVAINGEQSDTEELITSFRHLEDTVGLSLLKRMMFSVSVKERFRAEDQWRLLIRRLPDSRITPFTRLTLLNRTIHKVIIRFGELRESPIPVYWTYFGRQLVVCFSEKNMRKVIQASRSRFPRFYHRMALKKLSYNVLSYLWVDNSYIMNQLGYLYELGLASLRNRQYERLHGNFHFNTLIPLYKKISGKMGTSLSVLRLTKRGVTSESVSTSGVGVSNFITPLAGGMFFGMGYYLFASEPSIMLSERGVAVQSTPVEKKAMGVKTSTFTGTLIKSYTQDGVTASVYNTKGYSYFRKGNNEFALTFEKDGKPFNAGKNVKLNFYMPPMPPSMPEMTDVTTITPTDEKGVYKGKIKVQMGGNWTVNIQYGDGKTMSFPVRVKE